MLNLTQEYFKELLYYCPDTGLFRWRKLRGGMKPNSIAGSVRKNTTGIKYIQIKIHKIAFQAHRLAWFYMYGEFPPEVVDHVDGDGSNNALNNLRSVSIADNGKNTCISKYNKSGLSGVYLKGKKWRACIGASGKKQELGYYSDFFEACCARKSAENRLGYHPNHGRSRDRKFMCDSITLGWSQN